MISIHSRKVRQTHLRAPHGVRKIFGDERVGYLFVGPAMIFLVLIMVFPLIYAATLSTQEVSTLYDTKFVGLANFSRALRDPAFWRSMKVTMVFTFISVTVHMVFGFLLALLLSQPLKGIAVFRFLLLIPWMVSQVVTGVTWRWILNAQYGIANEALVQLGLIEAYVPWLADPKLSQIAVIAAYAWQCIPFAMIMLYAGLQTIPGEQREAARIDGANGLQMLWHVTLPNLKYVFVATSLMDFIWAFRAFDIVKVMTDGGPMRFTELLSLLIYRTTFEYYDFGYASAMAVLMLIVTLAFSTVYTRVMMRED